MIREREFSFVAESSKPDVLDFIAFCCLVVFSARSAFNLFNYNVKIETLKIYFFNYFFLYFQ